MGDQPRRVSRPVLAVRVDDEDEGTGRIPKTGFDGGAIALVVRMANDARAGRSGALRRLVPRPIVDDQYLAPVRGRAKPADEPANPGLFLEGWHNDRRGIG